MEAHFKADQRLLDKTKLNEITKKIGKLLPPFMEGLSTISNEYNEKHPLEFSQAVTSALTFIITEMTSVGEKLCIDMAHTIIKMQSSIVTPDEAREIVKGKKPDYVG